MCAVLHNSGYFTAGTPCISLKKLSKYSSEADGCSLFLCPSSTPSPSLSPSHLLNFCLTGEPGVETREYG